MPNPLTFLLGPPDSGKSSFLFHLACELQSSLDGAVYFVGKRRKLEEQPPRPVSTRSVVRRSGGGQGGEEEEEEEEEEDGEEEEEEGPKLLSANALRLSMKYVESRTALHEFLRALHVLQPPPAGVFVDDLSAICGFNLAAPLTSSTASSARARAQETLSLLSSVAEVVSKAQSAQSLARESVVVVSDRVGVARASPLASSRLLTVPAAPLSLLLRFGGVRCLPRLPAVGEVKGETAVAAAAAAAVAGEALRDPKGDGFARARLWLLLPSAREDGAEASSSDFDSARLCRVLSWGFRRGQRGSGLSSSSSSSEELAVVLPALRVVSWDV